MADMDFREGTGCGATLGGSGAPPGSTARGGLDDRHELGGGQAGAADQGAVDVGHGEQLGGIVGLDRAAVEDADRGRRVRRSGRPARRGSRRASRRRRPGWRHCRCRSPRSARRRRPARRPPIRRAASRRASRSTTARCSPAWRWASLSPTQTMAVRPAASAASALARTSSSRLVLVGAALAMADDDQPRAGFLEHRRRDAAGMGAARRRVAILRADRQAARAGRRPARSG